MSKIFKIYTRYINLGKSLLLIFIMWSPALITVWCPFSFHWNRHITSHISVPVKREYDEVSLPVALLHRSAGLGSGIVSFDDE